MNLLIDVNHQLRIELTEIEKLLPNNLALPGKATGTELKEVYHGMKAKGMIVDARLAVQEEIPLIQIYSSVIYEINS